jgi:DNA primase large subunit
VPNLVDKRKVFLQGGWAYVPSREVSSIVYQEFETRLEKDLLVGVLRLEHRIHLKRQLVDISIYA